jgi:hypothetical protein
MYAYSCVSNACTKLTTAQCAQEGVTFVWEIGDALTVSPGPSKMLQKPRKDARLTKLIEVVNMLLT